jgi:hypothetical protein
MRASWSGAIPLPVSLMRTQTRSSAVTLQDPLVINFEGTAAELTERTYEFDLDSDGEADQIHFIGPNSGFLALDRDGSGTIDNGSELFGTSTGNGFAVPESTSKRGAAQAPCNSWTWSCRTTRRWNERRPQCRSESYFLSFIQSLMLSVVTANSSRLC